jgi:hypothetical protein
VEELTIGTPAAVLTEIVVPLTELASLATSMRDGLDQHRFFGLVDGCGW